MESTIKVLKLCLKDPEPVPFSVELIMALYFLLQLSFLLARGL